MSALETLEKFANPFGRIKDATDLIGDYTTMFYDSEMNVPSEKSNEHALELAFDQQKVVSPGPAGEGVELAEKLATGGGNEADDAHASWAKTGALLGLPFTPFLGPLAPIAGSIIGGGLGALHEPNAGHTFDGNAVGADLAAQASGLMASANAPATPSPSLPPPPGAAEYLANHPFGNFAF